MPSQEDPESDTRDVLRPVPFRRVALKWGERLVTLAVLGFALYRLGPQLGALTGVGPDLGRSPQYEITALDGSSIQSEGLIGKVVVLNFWATWCRPCRFEMPTLQALHEDREQDGVVVLGLSTDVGRPAELNAFLSLYGITYPIGRALNDHRQAFGGVSAIPTTFIIDRDGLVRHRVVGYFAPPALRAAVDRLLEETSEASAGRASVR